MPGLDASGKTPVFTALIYSCLGRLGEDFSLFFRATLLDRIFRQGRGPSKAGRRGGATQGEIRFFSRTHRLA